ncbi:hypothetical protein Dsin_005086 [Dipteronia sinensis]|uniref:Ubiquitin-like protease family profile domain-containing protein n=1 Tax=Dipteronia sinensis TaxID=43782 RepID=A0AAE0AX56_9ROSI|nr:hypothetical protein Dsin_005086 [Dipteronia sinensis]
MLLISFRGSHSYTLGHSLASCLVGRDDKFKYKFKEGVDALAKRKVEMYNVYGFLTAFQVWGIEAIPKWATVGYAVRLTIYKVLGPYDDESKKPYWTGMDQLQYVSPDLDGCDGEDDVEDDVQDDIGPHGVTSPDFVVVSEASGDVKQLTRPPKLTIKVLRDRKRSGFTVSPYVDPTAKRPRKPKMPKFESDNQVDEEILRSMQSWIKDNKNTCMNIGLLETKPTWFELLLSPKGWLEGDILFPANINGNHWVAVEVNLKERAIKVYDSYPDANSVDQILRCATCLRKMLPSLLVHAMPDTYNDPTSFAVERPEEGVPHQGNESDCGIFTLKFLEYLWVGKQFDFEAKDRAPLRVKIATEIFQNSKEVPSVNDAN